jgi:phage shock protein E
MNDYTYYTILAAILFVFVGRRWFTAYRIRKNLPQYFKEGAVIIDVRSREEFSAGHAKGSTNIPLDEIAQKAGSLDKNKKILLCCASGARSGVAISLLKRKGFTNLVNAGSWQNVNVES